MPSFDLTSGDLILMAIAIALVLLPSQLPKIGNLIGRLVRGKPAEESKQ
jgi:hypothetical protein